MSYECLTGDCREVMAGMKAESVDAVVTDPPYGLSFMGKGWDHGVPGAEFWTEVARVSKPGAHLLAFGGTRTFHRLACAIEDAGWEIRDCVMWVYGSGFPKSLDVSKAIDKAAGADRTEVVGSKLGRPGMAKGGTNQSFSSSINTYGRGGLLSTDITAPATDAARQWAGWGTALKPAWEPIIVARKPLVGTVAENVQRHGTGAINVDGCRVGTGVETWPATRSCPHDKTNCYTRKMQGDEVGVTVSTGPEPAGRWPANLIHDGSDEVVGMFPNVKAGGSRANTQRGQVFVHGGAHESYGDSGSAARFFYCAKASKADRDAGCEGMEEKTLQAYGDFAGTPEHGAKQNVKARNHHPTVKPTDLMRYLCRLVTPPRGLVLDPFMGSGSTGKAALLEGFSFVGIEREPEYVEIAQARIKAASKEMSGLLF